MEERETPAVDRLPAEGPPTPDRSGADPGRRHSFQQREKRRGRSQWEGGGDEEEEGGVRKRRRGRRHQGKETGRLRKRRKRRRRLLLAKTSLMPSSTSTQITCRCRAPPPCSSPQRARWSRWRWWYRRESSGALWSLKSTRWGSCWSCRGRRAASAPWLRRWRSTPFSQEWWEGGPHHFAWLAGFGSAPSDWKKLFWCKGLLLNALLLLLFHSLCWSSSSSSVSARSPSSCRLQLVAPLAEILIGSFWTLHTECLSSHLPSSYENLTSFLWSLFPDYTVHRSPLILLYIDSIDIQDFTFSFFLRCLICGLDTWRPNRTLGSW